MSKKKILGDFQTPLPLAEAIVALLKRRGFNWDRVLEPTCGKGNFIRTLADSNESSGEIIGIEIQDDYFNEATLLNQSDSGMTKIIKGDILQMDLGTLEWSNSGQLLILGNPPWVTNSDMSVYNGDNLPIKSNFYGLKGIEALTGKSNFDITEYILLKLIAELGSQNPIISLLCKTSVARKVIKYLHKNKLPVQSGTVHKIDAGKWFDAAVDACLFTIVLTNDEVSYEFPVYESLNAETYDSVIGFSQNKIVADIEKYKQVEFIEGKSKIEWRQGVKHDATSVMELSKFEGEWRNSFNEIVEVESDYIYPYIKGSDISTKKIPPERGVIITQRRVGEDTTQLKNTAPKLWEYLNKYIDIFDSRKSKIYQKKHPFSIFGIGDYSFTDYRIIVGGMYKEPHFKPFGKKDGKPILCDDTCYLLPCDSATQAALLSALLNNEITIEFIRSIYFSDSKRPITKALLSRIDLQKLLEVIPSSETIIAYNTYIKSISNQDHDLITKNDFCDILAPGESTMQRALF